MATTATTKAMAGLLALAAGIAAWDYEPERAPPQCPPIGPGALWLPSSHSEAMPDLRAFAERLNAAGDCVIEGAFGTEHGRFYLTVKRPGAPAPVIQRYTRADLRAR
jgi:hypothetical protein